MDKNPFRYFDNSPEVIRLVVMMYVRQPTGLTVQNSNTTATAIGHTIQKTGKGGFASANQVPFSVESTMISTHMPPALMNPPNICRVTTSAAASSLSDSLATLGIALSPES
jgi:hypothetical protein